MSLTWSASTLELAQPFWISRGAMSSRAAVTITLAGADPTIVGRGEVVTSTYSALSLDRIETQLALIRRGYGDGADLDTVLPAVHPAVAAAVWSAVAEHRARSRDQPLATHLGLPLPESFSISRTIGIGTPQSMAVEAAQLAAAGVRLMKVKTDADAAESVRRLVAVAAAAPAAELIIDPNEAWTATTALGVLTDAQGLPVTALEQPLPAGDHDGTRELRSRTDISLIADEAVHTLTDLDRLDGLADAVNIKLPKCGGIFQAHKLATAARERGLDVMLGCLVCSSLGIAPAVHLASLARWCDLDGHLLLAWDPWTGLGGEDGTLRPRKVAGLGVHPREGDHR
ncbi:enolase C-terminal domain-like protein [Prescottella equi]